MANSQLIRELQAIVGKQYVLHAPEDLLVYEYDATIERGLPEAVVLPATAQQVAEVVKVARRHDLPVVARGAGTGLSGGAIPAKGGVTIAMSRMRRILEVDAENRLAVVEPGVINLDISKAVAAHGLYYAADPASQKACTIGGNVAENAGGPHCLAYGVTQNHVLGLEVVLADGSIIWLGGKTADRPGYDLRGVVIGSEGTLAIVTKVIVRLSALPPATVALLAIFDEVDQASQAVSTIIGQGILPAALEMMDKATMEAVEAAVHAGYPPDAGAVLLIEVDGLEESLPPQAEQIEGICRELGAREVRVGFSPQDRERLWAGRKGALGALGRLAPSYFILDGTVPRTQLPRVLRGVYEVGEKYGLRIANVFHAGDGNLHPNILFDEAEPGQVERAAAAGAEILRICVEAGGTITGEHGIGMEKRDFMRWIFSEDDIDAQARIKIAFGTGDGFNPEKIFPASSAGEAITSQRSVIQSLGPDAYI
jgi:glycolate dehydrogenase FAD-linked subunit